MHKFFVHKDNIIGDKAYIKDDDVKHIYKVLRLKVGDTVNINNCNGEEFLGKIEEINKQAVIVSIIKQLEINNESNIEISLFQGMPKSTKMDLIVQKSTELGTREITPVITERVDFKNDFSEIKKVDRWNRIALEASKQSKRSLITKINTSIKFDEMLARLRDMDLIVVPYENKEDYGIKRMINAIDKSTIHKVGIVIGPEGGFEIKEIDRLSSIGAHIVTLGPRILRTETAGFVCISLLMYELADLGGVF
ncbi:16S rRNA (uracil(1498)-N(3))-methyltransferase [Clostridium fermenticellae]|uniref:Ribosomal RNA small subunit methyltransferase E n=1 Tax=Clostridium fermenticellae TaxID=2068654 RepID=A0A386H614_9CLOT|nr:16S rRNA (uracil(1498)-N(3))-methyltransferase [Clostridium fermenticellae]AYD40983.1 16S rRNA (uracil(1498)-N(3))-methyltransferase [Clostridium fermenticellae]